MTMQIFASDDFCMLTTLILWEHMLWQHGRNIIVNSSMIYHFWMVVCPIEEVYDDVSQHHKEGFECY